MIEQYPDISIPISFKLRQIVGLEPDDPQNLPLTSEQIHAFQGVLSALHENGEFDPKLFQQAQLDDGVPEKGLLNFDELYQSPIPDTDTANKIIKWVDQAARKSEPPASNPP
jgi:hypothetical protein